MPAYRDEKTKNWYVKFRYTDWQGNSKHTTKRGFKTKKEALNYEYEFKATSKERIDITIAELAAKYLEDRKLHIKPSRYAAMEQIIRNHILPYIGNLKLLELTPLTMRHWQNELMKQNFSSSTLITYHRQCSTLLNFGVKYYGMKENPLRKVGSIGKMENRIDFWEPEEFQRFIDVVNNPKYKLCFLLLFYSGMRVGELLALNAGDFNFSKNKISITKSLMHVTKEITTPKTECSIRVIEMPSGVMQEVKSYIEKLEEVPSPLFKVSSLTLLQALKRYAKQAEVKEICLHDLRHSNASFLIHVGIPITTISKRLGHKSPNITLAVYSHMYRESDAQAAKFLQDNFVSQALVNKK